MTPSLYESVILVNPQDKMVGTAEKLFAHRHGLLHRAISVFVFNDDDALLLQRRAAHKYHSGDLWSNTCCSHPRPSESTLDAANRRLFEEMGIRCTLTKAFDFIYKTSFANGLIEHELDHVFIGRYDGQVKPNPQEASAYHWVTKQELDSQVTHSPHAYSYWFKAAYERTFAHHEHLRKSG